MNLEKLKETARKFEQKEEWRKAIEVYLKAIHQVEEGNETAPDLSLYNRVGDLYLKTNDTSAAVRSYERAVDLYADQGFFNNAIALCGKILRVNPARTQTYLKLAQLHARKNVVIEAKRNLIEFLERMNALGQLEQAFQSVKEFADQFSGSQEIRMMLVELLRAASREDEAREQLEKLAADLEARGDTVGARRTRERLYAIDQIEPESSPPAATGNLGGLVFLDTGVSSPAAPPPAPPPPGLIPTAEETPPPAALGPADTALPGLERTGELDLSSVQGGAAESVVEPLEIDRVEPVGLEFEGTPLEGIESTSVDEVEVEDLAAAVPDADAPLETLDEPGLEPALGDGLATGLESGLDTDLVEPMDLDLGDIEPEADAAEAEGAGLPFIEVDEPPFAPSPDSRLAELENEVLDDPDNPDLHRDLAEALFAADQPERAVDELELALTGYEARGEWAAASAVAERFLAVFPDRIAYHQKRVELAYRMGERGPLINAYLALAETLARIGAVDKAIAVYHRVREHEPGNARAAAALAGLAEEQAEAAPPAGVPARPAVRSAPGAPPVSPAPTASAPISSPPMAPAAPSPLSSPAASAPPPSAPAPSSASAPAPAPASASTPALAPAAPSAPSAPTAASAAPSGTDFIDLGSLIFEDPGTRDTRMRIDRREPVDEDEQKEFQEILEQFKRGIEQNLGDEDYQAHYDLGVAFKEMGLLDEAIAEFQKALRAPDGRLRTSEALGAAFFAKGQYAVAEAVLRRAVETLDGGDDAKIALIYWLGRAQEAQGKETEALACYERALAVDIRFMDLGECVERLTVRRRA